MLRLLVQRALSHKHRCSGNGGLCAVALFVFLAGAAGAGIVSSDLLLAAHDLLDGALLAAASHTRLFQLTALLALESFFEVINRSGDTAGRTSAVAIAAWPR